MSTIDPGVEEGIKDGANEIESDQNEEIEEREHLKEDFLQPSRWWFASTACPLLAGTFGPMASGFNICALAYYWREYIPPGTLEQNGLSTPIPDPPWVLAINTLSLVSALVGNASLLLNMAHRVKFSIAQPITISGFFLASVLLIADMAALTASSDYRLQNPQYQPDARHALTGAFYYAIWAAAIYMLLGMLMCVTVYGARSGHYSKDFHLTSSQRTLMLQTMSFVAYLLLGALVYCNIEGWDFLDAVYWADVTLLTVGFGDFSPSTQVGRGLLFPFSMGGILIIGLVIGSIRSLILERGKEKMAARIVEKRRSTAVHNVDDRKQTIKISMFASADFNTDPELSPAQRREEEFNVMRKVQDAAGTERKYFALATSGSFALVLWFVGAVIFMETEYLQGWTYFQSLYFSFVALMTIGYGDFMPKSNSGRAFFVLWSLLAVPSLTILISNMGDTIVQWVSDLTNIVGEITVLPDEGGMRKSFQKISERLKQWIRNSSKSFRGPGLFGTASMHYEKRISRTEYENKMLDRLAERLTKHVDKDEFDAEKTAYQSNDEERDVQFYHYVLARECRTLQKDLNASPPKKYDWSDWEYYLKLMGDKDDPVDYPGQKHPDILVPDALRAPDGLAADDPGHEQKAEQGPKTGNGHDSQQKSDGEASSSDDQTKGPSPVDGNIDRQTSLRQKKEAHEPNPRRRRPRNPDEEPDYLTNWSWLSNESPLMSQKSESQWILDRLSAALERELNRSRKGYKTTPPISLKNVRWNNPDGMDAGMTEERQKLESTDKSEESLKNVR